VSEESDRSTRMATISHRGGEDSERSAVKRCFSPGSPGSWDVKRNRSRKHKPDPLLVVLQRGVLSTEGPRWPLSSMSRQEASLTSFSSSYTSWTQPEVGRQQSDSCVPASSILDMPEDSPPEAGRRSRSRSRSPRIQPRQRNRSADTSKDISEIDDLELDVLENQFDIELPHDDEERNKNQWKVKSPDLAYSSMEPSRQAEP